MTLRRLRPLAFVFTALLLDCATLSPLPEGTCGNKVIDDATEDCDGEVVAGRACGSPSSGVTACRLLCAIDGDCPDGWGCAHEGYCRTPTGQFAKATDAVSSEVTSMAVGDFDGDRRDDILAMGPRGGDNAVRTKVLYFGPGGALEHTNALAAPIVSPEPHDFDGDDITDFSFGSAGFAIIRGQGDRSLVPVTFPSRRVPKLDGKPVFIHGTLRALPGNFDDSADPLSSASFVVAGLTENGPALVSLDKDKTGGQLYVALPAPINQLVGTPVAGRFLALDVASTCEDVVVAMNTGPASGEIDIISPCRGARWADMKDAASPIVRIKIGEALVGGVFLANIEGAFLDLMYGTATGVYVMKGNGTKSPQAAKHVDSIDFKDVPIAARDIDFDGHPDFVTPTGVVLSVAPPSALDGGAPEGGPPAGDGGKLPPHLATFKILDTDYFSLPSPRGTRWTTAAIEDINSDLFLDVVAGSSEVPDLDLVQTGVSGVTFSTIPTNGPVRFIQLGDYDGDKVSDVAFVESRIAAGDAAVMFAYGKSAGPPEVPRLVGRLPDIVGFQVDTTTFPNNVNIFSREPVSNSIATFAQAALLGSGDRQPLAPLLLLGDKSQEQLGTDVSRRWVPMTVHAGKFGQGSANDMFALATGYTFTGGGTVDFGNSPSAVWLARSTGTLTYDSAKNISDLSSFALIDPSSQVFQAPTVTSDIDSPLDGLVESLTLVRIKGQAHPSVVVVRPGLSGGQAYALPDQTSITARSSISALDADGDGKNDIAIVVTNGAEGTAPTAPTRAFILLNIGGGSFDATKLIEVVPPPRADGGTEDDTGPAALGLVTVAGANASAGGLRGRKIAIVTQHRLLLATVSADKTKLEYTELTDLFGKRGLVSGTGVASGDFDGDGVEDLAIADAGSVRLLLQVGRLK